MKQFRALHESLKRGYFPISNHCSPYKNWQKHLFKCAGEALGNASSVAIEE